MDGAATEKRVSQLFGEVAIRRGLCTEEQIAEALARQRALRERGIHKTLGAVLHDMEVLTLVQVNEVLDEIDGTRRRHSIEGYEILQRLGKGGMGTVYLARQLSMNRLVAIKVLPPRLAQNKDYLLRFRREAEATAKLNHPNIVAAYDVGSSNGYHYFVMEYVEGEMVKELLERTGTIEEARAVEIAIQTAEALRHAWEHGIVHRDIKPANIMIGPNGVVKVCDLGLAIDRATDGSITRTGVIMGTPYYLSPEQARSEPLDIRSDIYSLGATLFHMVTGQVPYDGDSPAAILTAHLTEPVPDPRSRNPVISPSLAAVIMRMLAKDREQRYQNPEELLADLRAVQQQRPLPIIGAIEAEQRQLAARLRRRRLALLLLAALALGALLAPLLRPRAWVRAAGRLAALVEQGRHAQLASLAATEQRLRDPDGTLERRARLALEELERALALRPDDVATARAQLASLAAAYPDTRAAAEALSRLRAIDARLDREAKAAFFALVTEARALREAGRFAEARQRLRSFPARYAVTAWQGQIEKELQVLHAAARARWEELRARALGLLDRGELEAAQLLLGAAEQLGYEELVAEAAALRAEIETRHRSQLSAAARAAREERRRLRRQALEHLSRCARAEGLGRAAAEATQLAADPAFGPVREELERVRADLALLAQAAARAQAALQAQRGQQVELRIGGVERRGTLLGMEDGELLLRSGAATLRYAFDDLDPAAWLDPEAVGGASAASRLQGVLALLGGRSEAARTALEAAAAAGEDVALYLGALPGPD